MRRRRALLAIGSGVVTGAELIVLFVADVLRSRGHAVTLACRPGALATRAREDGLAVVELPFRKAYDAESALRLRRELARGYAVVHSFNEIADGVAFAGSAATGVAHVSTQPNLVTAAAPKRALHRRLLERCAAVSAVSRALVRDWESALARRVHYTPSHLRMPVRPEAEAVERSRRPARVVGCVARMSPQKGIDVFVRAAALLRGSGLELRFVGDDPAGDDCDARFRARVLSDAAELGAGIDFRPRTADVAGVLDELDLLVLPSRWEGTPLTLLEAMARGVPAVASDVPGNDEAVLDGRTGLLVPPEDPAALAAAVRRAAADADLRERLVRGARIHVQRYSEPAAAAAYLDLYAALAA